jgi:hypothetical protein
MLNRSMVPEESAHRATEREPLAVAFPQHADQHRPEDPVLLAVDQQFGDSMVAPSKLPR